MKKFVFAVLVFLAGCAPAFAESLVVQNCGTNPQAYTAGATRLDTVDVNGVKCFSSAGGYPSGATPISASLAAASTTGTTITLPAAAGKTTYICGVYIAANATAATSGFAFISGTVSGSINLFEPIAALPAVGQVVLQPFSPCVPASAPNTAILITTANPGAGGSQVLSAWGFQQ